jgi:hypothetical protein
MRVGKMGMGWLVCFGRRERRRERLLGCFWRAEEVLILVTSGSS